MELEALLLQLSQESCTGAYLGQINPVHNPVPYFKFTLIVSPHLTQGRASSFSSSFPAKVSHIRYEAKAHRECEKFRKLPM